MAILASANPSGGSGSAPLPGFLNSLGGPLDHYGYWAIALLLLLENIGVPVIPGELAMIAGAIFAGTGRAGLNIVGVGVVAVVAAIVGAEIGYLIGRFAGRELVLRYGKYVLLKPEHLDRAEALVSRYGGIVVVIARFIVGLREANGIIAGITQMRLLTFTFFNVLGAFAWVATWVTLGYVAGDHIATIYADVNRYFLYLLIALGVLFMVYVGRRLMRRRRLGQPRETTRTQEGPAEGIRTPESTQAGEPSGAEVALGSLEDPEPHKGVQEGAAEVPGAAAEVPDLKAAGESEDQGNSQARETLPKSS